MLKKEYAEYQNVNQGKGVCGKEKFEGYCVDLAAMVADYCKFDYDICIVEDGEYGKKQENGTWNGMIGDLTKKVKIIDLIFINVTCTVNDIFILYMLSSNINSNTIIYVNDFRRTTKSIRDTFAKRLRLQCH